MLYKKLKTIISSRYFTWAVVVIFTLQAIWFAVSLRNPIIFDEKFHFEVISAFTDKWTPYLTNESANIYHHQDLEHRAGLLYHYLMSMPLRIIELLTNNIDIQVILLRLVNVVLAALGLIFFIILLRKAKLPWYAINIGIMIYAVLPMNAYIAGTINYDNAVFVLFPLFSLAILQAITSSGELRLKALLWVIILGCATSLMKYTFLPVFAVGVIFTIGYLCYRSRFLWLTEIMAVLRNIKQVTTYILVAAALAMAGLFSSVYIKNIIQFGAPNPSCQVTLSHEKCMKNGIYGRNYNALQTKHERTPMPFADYVLFSWVKSMTLGFSYVAVATHDGVQGYKPLPVFYSATGLGFIAAVAILLAGWRKIPRNEALLVYVVLAVGTTLVLLIYNINSYYHYNDIFANHARYLIFVVPLFATLTVYVLNEILEKRYLIKTVIIATFLLIISQGGGVLSYIARSESNWYIENNRVEQVNRHIKNISDKIILFR